MLSVHPTQAMLSTAVEERSLRIHPTAKAVCFLLRICNPQDVLYRKKIYSENEFSIPVVVAQAVAHVSDREFLELEPLYSYLDSDALSDLLETDSYLEVEFYYEGYQVNVRSADVRELTVMKATGCQPG